MARLERETEELLFYFICFFCFAFPVTAGQNKQASAQKNTAKLDQKTEELHHRNTTSILSLRTKDVFWKKNNFICFFSLLFQSQLARISKHQPKKTRQSLIGRRRSCIMVMSASILSLKNNILKTLICFFLYFSSHSWAEQASISLKKHGKAWSGDGGASP